MAILTRNQAISQLTSATEEVQNLANVLEEALWGLRSPDVQELVEQIRRSALQLRLESTRISDLILNLVERD